MGSIDDMKHLSLNGYGTASSVQELDALIVGAGFGGAYQLWKLRNEGYNVKLVETGTNYGGVWYWNRYPGARVDSAIPHYEFSDPALWKDWIWKQRFPGSAELRAYFAHVADTWDLRKDTKFNTFVENATWDDGEARWTVKTREGDTFSVRYLLLNTGFAAKRYIPEWKGIEKFQGTFIHPSYWPHEEPNLKGKKVAVIGTGSTGIQLATDLSKVAGFLAVFQRTPNMSLPMKQIDYNLPEQALPKPKYPDFFHHRTDSFSGFSFNFLPRSTFDDTPEKRSETYESLWAEGDFKFWLATYYDMLFSEEANREAYNFWRDKTRAKIHDSKIADILAPMKQPHAFGCKRVSLENGYFEIFNEPHVKLVDMRTTPIQELSETGIKTTEEELEFDYIICATGYDAITGGLAQIDIRGPSGESLKEHWKDGAKTYLGMSVAGFPNMFFTYGPQAPTAFCNGPTCAELQGNWIVGVMNHMREKGLRKVDAERESEKKWKDEIWKLANASLLPSTKSWYMGDNIPGKPREPLIYLGGVPTYYKTVNECAANGYTGFKLEK
ncbi:cyclopentanone 1,2-monooxygenase [Zopfia rhizophila CBS 207.26]|uniref:Cyclopentanone 1,2-monooxygenase n=1 Tax=Zopfia rhizophila CBS 207.26 TaxID=1314779 RepID=A0A6A6E4M4_9PEZI|nr:cyclopentanone 1,2-monooxygenase [Zopfia rhizophila CBS 207.26]